VKLVDFARLPFRKQVEEARKARAMLGMHGAGMVHLLFLPDEAAIAEFFPKKKRRYTYRNLAKYTGKAYFAWRSSSDTSKATPQYVPLEVVKEIVDSIPSFEDHMFTFFLGSTRNIF
jgi:capsular polysaccharide biosynthesis protein